MRRDAAWFSVVQRVAAFRCSALQRDAVVPQSVASCCRVLQSITECCSAFCSVLQCVAVCCSSVEALSQTPRDICIEWHIHARMYAHTKAHLGGGK